MQRRYAVMVRSNQQRSLSSGFERYSATTTAREASQHDKYDYSCQTIENLLSLGGQPILENPIVSSTPTNRLSALGFSRFSYMLVENEWRLLRGKKDPLKNAYLKARLRKGFKRAGFTKPLPRKGTETLPGLAEFLQVRVHQTTTPQGDGNRCY